MLTTLADVRHARWSERRRREIGSQERQPSQTPARIPLRVLRARIEMPARYTSAWRRRRPADLAVAGYACQRCHVEDRPFGTHSNLERAHLDGNPHNDSPENVAVLCRKDHRAHDLPQWLEARRIWLQGEKERRIAEKDAGRPILQFLLQEAS